MDDHILDNPRRSCNRHDDCDKFDKEYKEKYKVDFVPYNQHCHDEECEDCFGC